MLISFLIFQISTNVAIVPVLAITVNATISRAHSNASAAAATLWHPAVTLVLILTSVNAIPTFATTELVSTLSVLTNAIVIPVLNSVPTTIAPVSFKVIFKNYTTLHHWIKLPFFSRSWKMLTSVVYCLAFVEMVVAVTPLDLSPANALMVTHSPMTVKTAATSTSVQR